MHLPSNQNAAGSSPAERGTIPHLNGAKLTINAAIDYPLSVAPCDFGLAPHLFHRGCQSRRDGSCLPAIEKKFSKLSMTAENIGNFVA